jgi:antitoxin (DNA-binding transcriptional repressor) of toxin-antitoxin stability system
MRSVGIKILKNKLSEYVRLAATGETVLVTDRDRIVAELGPPQPGRTTQSVDEFFAQGAREGWLKPARITNGSPPPEGKPVMTFEELMEDLRKDRDDP